MGTSKPGQMGSGNLYQTRKGTKYNTKFWARLKEFENNYHRTITNIEDLMDQFEGYAENIRYDLPKKYGGLQKSFTVEKENTPSGISVAMYLKDEPHEVLSDGWVTVVDKFGREYKNYKPENQEVVRTDKFTNPTLAGWLEHKKSSAPKMEQFRNDQKELIDRYKLYLRMCWKEEFRK